jgi:uncharacterized protein (DUF1697 family)
MRIKSNGVMAFGCAVILPESQRKSMYHNPVGITASNMSRYTECHMTRYILLLRGINVGGKNKVQMAELKHCLEELGCANVRTYINSGNVLLESEADIRTLGGQIEHMLPQEIQLDSTSVKVLLLQVSQLAAIVAEKPKDFGERPEEYQCDVLFLIDISEEEALKVFNPRDGVDTIWRGKGVIYSQRDSVLRTKSRLGKIVGTDAYKSMTIRSWNTTVKLLALAESNLKSTDS